MFRLNVSSKSLGQVPKYKLKGIKQSVLKSSPQTQDGLIHGIKKHGFWAHCFGKYWLSVVWAMAPHCQPFTYVKRLFLIVSKYVLKECNMTYFGEGFPAVEFAPCSNPSEPDCAM